MKTAEEWCGVYYQVQRNYPDRPPGTLHLWIKQIQLDAWKQGMSDACSLATDSNDKRTIALTIDNTTGLV